MLTQSGPSTPQIFVVVVVVNVVVTQVLMLIRLILSICPVFFASKITMGGVRRLLEEDLELDKKTLDPMKKFINEQLDEVSKKIHRNMSFEVL